MPRVGISLPVSVQRTHVLMHTLSGEFIYQLRGYQSVWFIYRGFLRPKATDWQRHRYPAFLFVWSVIMRFNLSGSGYLTDTTMKSNNQFINN